MHNNVVKKIGIIMIIPLVLYLFFMLFAPGLKVSSTHIIMSQTMIPFVIAMGVAFTFLVGIFEMSVGAQVILTAMLGGLLARYLGFTGLLIGCIGGGIGLGYIMGFIYKYLKIPTMVISLGMALAFEAIGSVITKGTGFIKLDPSVAELGNKPYNFVIAAVAGVVFFIINYKIKYGFQARALGNNDVIAIGLGLNNDNLKILSYVFGGLFYGIAGVLTICYSGSISASMELKSLSMVFPPVISVLIALQLRNVLDNFPITILIGAFSITILFTGLIAMGLPATIQNLMTGVFMLVVMVVSVNRNLVRVTFQTKRTQIE